MTGFPRLKILCYHSIRPGEPGTKWSVPFQRFAAQMRYLVGRHVPVIPLDEGVASLASGEGPSLAVSLTFDDAYLDNHQYAFPLLRELGLPAALFIPGGQVGMGRDRMSGGEQPRMNWDELAACVGAGILVGVHGLKHRDLVHTTDAELREEVETSRDLVARYLGIAAPGAFCYPYGSCNARIRRAVRDAGYSYAVSTSSPRSQTLLSDRFDLRRETVYGNTPLWAFAAKTNHGWDGVRSFYWFPAKAMATATRGVARRCSPLDRSPVVDAGRVDGRQP